MGTLEHRIRVKKTHQGGIIEPQNEPCSAVCGVSPLRCAVLNNVQTVNPANKVCILTNPTSSCYVDLNGA